MNDLKSHEITYDQDGTMIVQLSDDLLHEIIEELVRDKKEISLDTIKNSLKPKDNKPYRLDLLLSTVDKIFQNLVDGWMTLSEYNELDVRKDVAKLSLTHVIDRSSNTHDLYLSYQIYISPNELSNAIKIFKGEPKKERDIWIRQFVREYGERGVKGLDVNFYPIDGVFDEDDFYNAYQEELINFVDNRVDRFLTIEELCNILQPRGIFVSNKEFYLIC